MVYSLSWSTALQWIAPKINTYNVNRSPAPALSLVTVTDQHPSPLCSSLWLCIHSLSVRRACSRLSRPPVASPSDFQPDRLQLTSKRLQG